MLEQPLSLTSRVHKEWSRYIVRFIPFIDVAEDGSSTMRSIFALLDRLKGWIHDFQVRQFFALPRNLALRAF